MIDESEIAHFQNDLRELLEDKQKNREKIQILFVNFFLENLLIITTIEDDEIFIYDSNEGIWLNNGKNIIRAMIGEIENNLSINLINEIVDKIRRRTYRENSIFQSKNVIPLKNGVFDLERWEFMSHSPNYYLRTKLNVEYKPCFYPERFAKFLDEILSENQKNLILEMMGYCLYPSYKFHKAFLLTGSGSNGKTTLLRVLTEVLGPQNVAGFSLQQLENSQYNSSQLFGKFANICADMSQKTLYKTSIFKTLTGGDQTSHERKYKEPITFINFCKLIFSANELPAIREDTHAIWRRVILIVFEKTIPEERQDENLIEKLTTEDEKSGILNLMLFALRNLIDRKKFSSNKNLYEIREQYIKKSDVIHAFCEDWLECDDKGWISSDELFRAQCLYAYKIGVKPKSKQSLTKEIQLWFPSIYQQTRKINKKPVRGWFGLKFKEESEHFKT